MKGTIMKSTGSWYQVIGEDHKPYSCRVRGKFRLEGIKESNPFAVGDRVVFDVDHNEGIITDLLPRENWIERQSVKKTGHSHVLAANIDQILLIVTLKQPRTSLGFIDRFLVTAESFRIPQVLVINKRDLLNGEEIEKAAKLEALYSRLGIQVIKLSGQFDADINEVTQLLEGKVTLVAGHSGVGKSTLLNRLSPEIKQTVKEISSFSDKGTHSTTYAEMFKINESTFVIDTPGIKEWGLVEMTEQEISDYFPEMRDKRLDCRFGSKCLHISEPGCAVLDSLKAGEIALSRYESYVSMVSGEDNRK